MRGRHARAGGIFVALFLAACTSTPGGTENPQIPDASSLAPACSAEVPPACTGMTYLLLSGCSGFCTASAVYFLCDGTGFTSFSCSPPAAPWTPWDPASTLPDGGTTFDATTLDAGTGDAQTGDASDGVPDASSRG